MLSRAKTYDNIILTQLYPTYLSRPTAITAVKSRDHVSSRLLACSVRCFFRLPRQSVSPSVTHSHDLASLKQPNVPLDQSRPPTGCWDPAPAVTWSVTTPTCICSALLKLSDGRQSSTRSSIRGQRSSQSLRQRKITTRLYINIYIYIYI